MSRIRAEVFEKGVTKLHSTYIDTEKNLRVYWYSMHKDHSVITEERIEKRARVKAWYHSLLLYAKTDLQ